MLKYEFEPWQFIRF